MDMPLLWLIVGIVLITIETMILSLDFLALGMAALITAAVIQRVLPATWLTAVIVFGVVSVCMLIVTKAYIKPHAYKHQKDAMSIDKIIGHKGQVVELQNKLVVQYEGNYWIIENAKDCKRGDEVVIVAHHNNQVHVKHVNR